MVLIHIHNKKSKNSSQNSDTVHQTTTATATLIIIHNAYNTKEDKHFEFV